MGSYDRDYMRRSPGSSNGASFPGIGANTIVWGFLAVSVVVFLVPPLNDQWAFTSSGMRRGELWRFVSYQFAHVDLFHLAVNMLGLYLLGRTVVSRLGATQFAMLYLLGGICGAALEYGAHSAAGQPTAIVGASASLSALMFVFVATSPNLRFQIFPLPMALPLSQIAWGFLIINGGLGVASLSGIGVGDFAYLAHFGGAVYGMIHGHYFRDRIRLPKIRFTGPTPRPKRPVVYRSRPEQPNVIDAEFAPVSGTKSKADYNEVLDKINREGIGSLTPAERRILERASENLGRRND